MKNGENHFQGNTGIVKYRRYKFRVVPWIVFSAIALPTFIFCLKNIAGLLLFGDIRLGALDSYMVLILSSAVLSGSNAIILSYFGNRTYISENYITIKRGLTGRIYRISKRCIEMKTSVITSYRGVKSYLIILWLKNGRKISTGVLNCRDEDFYDIKKQFKFREITDRSYLKQEKQRLKGNTINREDLKIRTNYLLPAFVYIPLAVLILTTYLIASDYNMRGGSRENIHVTAVVVDKRIEEGRDNRHYRVEVKVEGTSEKYRLYLGGLEYETYSLNDRISITGTRGSLGILDDIRFFPAIR